ncbi:hypothetical protein BJF88_01695 [Cellulosimicrobium sp. CUA-896]|nr:hypothetical protein BJF88_01695 [Cellulosimicrobium sp. CUA-896]
MTIATMAITAVTPLSGSASRRPKSMSCGESRSLIAAPPCSRRIVVPPTTPNHTIVTRLGARMTVVTNSRSVRPRLIFATKMPTNGVHATHHAQ